MAARLSASAWAILASSASRSARLVLTTCFAACSMAPWWRAQYDKEGSSDTG